MLYRFSLSGVKCAGCVRSLEKGLQAAAAINDYSVNFADRSLTVSSDVSVEEIIAAIEQVGYGATELSDNMDFEQIEASEQAEYQAALLKSYIALGLGAIMMLQAWLGYMPNLASSQGLLSASLQGLLSLAVMVYCARHIYTGALQAFRRRSFNMDTLIAMGTGVAWSYSSALLIGAGFGWQLHSAASHLYYEAAVMIIGFILLGQALESRARKRTGDAIRQLLRLQPATALRIRDGEEKEVVVSLLAPGDRVRVRPGERIPVDGEVVTGESYIDESMMTGEPQAVKKSVQDKLCTGTLNGNGSLLMQVEQVGAQTVLAQIIESVREAQNTKPELGKLADRIAAVFVPVVMALSLLTAALWLFFGPEPALSYAIITSMTVLIIACPCALGLATPLSVMVAVGKAAHQGILIRNADALQQAKHLDTVVLDKTGTVTKGQPEVVAAEYMCAASEQPSVQRLLAKIESLSEHPLAAAVLKHLQEGVLQDAQPQGTQNESMELLDFHNHAGLGVTACANGVKVLVGNAKLMQNHGVNIETSTELSQQWSGQGFSVVYVALDTQLVALLAITDPIKGDSKASIAQLQRQGLKVILLSGDNQRTANVVAKAVGIDEVIAEVLPAEKQNVIAQLQQQGRCVAMVGDGINDAPALAQADIGYAIGTGADIAISSADVTLISGSLAGVDRAIMLSKAAVKNIKQNLFGAFVYNSLAIPLAAGALYPAYGILLNPAIAGAAMALSSITVVMNANRLRFSDLR